MFVLYTFQAMEPQHKREPTFKNCHKIFHKKGEALRREKVKLANMARQQKDYSSQSVDPISYDHQYIQNENTSNEGLDVQEETIPTEQTLPKNAVPVSKYRLVIELDHIISQ